MNEIGRSLRLETQRVLLATLLLLAPRAAAALGLADGNPKNGLSSQAFLRNALTTNPQALELVRSQPLARALIEHPLVHAQLHERGAAAMMEEIVRCALGPEKELTHVDLTGTRRTWRGELGLCQHPQLAVGDWSAGPPTQACQELVTACVMARVNALEAAIPLSLRGAPPELFPLRSAVGAERHLRTQRGDEDPADGTPIESFRWPVCQTGQDCQWAPAYVGTCQGGTVELVIDSPTVCGKTPIRVCGGIHGCDKPRPPGVGGDLPYSKFLTQRDGACAGAALSFACPTEPNLAGFYAVMVRRAGPITAPPPPVPAVRKVSGTGSYPAPEAEVFPHVEGAFWGNLFQPEQLAVHCQVDPANPPALVCRTREGTPELPPCSAAHPPPQCNKSATARVPYMDIYACYALTRKGATDAPEQDAVAYLNSRLCVQDGSDRPCFPSPPERCSARCEWDAEQGHYRDCRGDARPGKPATTYRPITTYLNAPCDLIGQTALCARVLKLIKLGSDTGAPRQFPGRLPGRGCAGCTSGGASSLSMPPLVLLGALLAATRRRRRA